MDDHHNDDSCPIRRTLDDLSILRTGFEEVLRLAPNLRPTVEPLILRCDQAGTAVAERVRTEHPYPLAPVVTVLAALKVAGSAELIDALRSHYDGDGGAS